MTRLIFLAILMILLLAACSESEKKEDPTATQVVQPVNDVQLANHEEESGDAERGAQIFQNGVNGSPACVACHETAQSFRPRHTAPNLMGISERAVERVEGLTAEEYISQSILTPGTYLVEDYNNIMYPNYAKHFSSEDVSDLIAYLLTL